MACDASASERRAKYAKTHKANAGNASLGVRYTMSGCGVGQKAAV